MKHLLLILVCLAVSVISYGQSGYGKAVIEITKLNSNCIFTKSRIATRVEVTGTFPLPDSTYRSKLEKQLMASSASIIIPKRAKKGKYAAAVVFIIAKDGSLSDIRCQNDPGYGICEAAIRVIKKSKNWTPATQQGSPVHSYRH